MLSLRKQNIILVLLDTLRYDCWVKIIGDKVSRLLNNITIFHNAFSTATWTPPSHASIFTGKYPHQHGVLAKGENVPPLREPGLAYKLKKLGYDTYAITSNPVVVPFIGRGFSRIIEVNVGRRRLLHEITPIKSLRSYYDPKNKFVRTIRKVIRNTYYFLKDLITLGEKYFGSSVVNQVIINLFKRKIIREPFFLFINYMDVHDYLCYTNIFNRWRIKITQRQNLLTKVYMNSCKRLAYSLKELFQLLQDQGFLDRSIVIITSDHGELLGEHGLVGHCHAYPFNELIHVPLVIYDPLMTSKVEVVRIVSIKDIYSFIINRVTDGKDIVEYIKSLPEYVVVEDSTLGSRRIKHYRCIIKPPYKIVFDVINRKYKVVTIKLRGYRTTGGEDPREVIELMKRVNAEAQIYEKLRDIRRKLIA